MKKEWRGVVSLWGNEYPVKVVNGERMVKVGAKWLTTDQFIETLPLEKVESLAFVGRIALRDEKLDHVPEKGKYQYVAEKLSSFS